MSPWTLTDIAVADIGGTHARLALARVSSEGEISLQNVMTLKVADHPSFESAWQTFAASLAEKPRNLSVAVAGPIEGDEVVLTNSLWRLSRMSLGRCGAERITLVNDFAAVAHAVAVASGDDLMPLCGPSDWPRRGMISVVGPGTGLGVVGVLRTEESDLVLSSEGGHVSFAPTNPIEWKIAERVAARHGRASAERIISGAGLYTIYQVLAEAERCEAPFLSDLEVWAAALDGRDAVAERALGQFCACLGSFAGDIALVHRADGLVVAGGLGLRLARHLAQSSFGERFIAKGRFKRMMELIPAKVLVQPQPGLVGAAAAFISEHQSLP